MMSPRLHCRVFRSPSLASAHATALRNQGALAADASAAAGGSRVNPRDAVYMLNPSGDLLHTQETFQDLFQRQAGWQVRHFGHHLSLAA